MVWRGPLADDTVLSVSLAIESVLRSAAAAKAS
jgi:hypothetical protein